MPCSWIYDAGEGAQPFLTPKQIKKLTFLLSRFHIKGSKCGIKYHDIYIFQSRRTTLCSHFLAHFKLMLLREGLLIFKNIL